MQKILLFCLLLWGAQPAFSQYKLSGTITNAETGEYLPEANIKATGGGVSSNDKGKYSFSLPTGHYTITYSHVGYEAVVKEIDLRQDQVVDVRLTPASKTMDELVVKGEAKDHNITSTEMSVEKLSIAQIEKIPVIMGETDIMKTIQLLPGITSIAEGRSGFIVRGSGIDQNLILMDGMPIYYSSHMQGLYSVFNSDAVDGLTIYKGGMPARFGGRGASVLDVRMRESNFTQFRAKLSAGLITSKFSVEAPVIKDKLSVFVSGRSSKLGFGSLYDRMNGQSGIVSKDPKAALGKGNQKYTFFDPYESWLDLNGKIIFKVNDRNSLFLSGYFGQDKAITAGGFTDWGNRAASLRWNHTFNNRLLSNTSFIHSSYYTHGDGGQYIFKSGITTNSFKQEFSFFPNDRNDIRFGFQTEYQDFDHGTLNDTEAATASGKFMPLMQGLETAFYIENDQKLTARLSAHYGLRYSLYHRLGPGDSFVYSEENNEPISKTPYSRRTDVMAFHHNLEPRLALTYLLNEKSSVKASYNRSAQYLRLMTLGAEIEWYDIWMPSTENIEPMLTDQVALGYFRNFLDNEIRFSAETYYKKLNGAADFEDGLHNYLVNNLEAYVATGIGHSYGLEVSLEKPDGRFTGRISYNLGHSEYKIDVINQARWYPNMFDKTHSLSVIASYELFKNLTLSSTFIYSTGRPVTLPESYYYISGVPFPYWEGRNKYRLPDYHRLDFGLKYEPDFLVINLKKNNRTLKLGLDVSLYNVYNRRNVNTINYTSNSPSKPSGKGGADATEIFQPYGVSIYGFMPSFSIHLKF